MTPFTSWLALTIGYAIAEYGFEGGSFKELYRASLYTAIGMLVYWFWHGRREEA